MMTVDTLSEQFQLIQKHLDNIYQAFTEVREGLDYLDGRINTLEALLLDEDDE